MSAQRASSVEPETAITAISPAPSKLVAASIPPELFKNILACVGDEARLGYDEYGPSSFPDTDARREEMKHLSACALTCVYWAQLTRQRMFQFLILRSSKDMSTLLSFFRAPQSSWIPHIRNILRELRVYHEIGDPPCFHNLSELTARYRVSRSLQIDLHITGPASPAFVAASTRGSVLHPLFFAAPRILPATFPKNCEPYIQNIHLPNPAMLFNLLQDCLSLQPRHGVNCKNLTWDLDPALPATPSSVGLKYACCKVNNGWNSVSGCTDNILVAAMLKSVPHHKFSRQPQDSHLNPLETSCLFDAMCTTWYGLSLELERTEGFRILSDSDSGYIQARVAVRLPAGTDFSLWWRANDLEFRCIASPLPHAPTTSNNVRVVTYVIINLQWHDNHHKLRRYMKTANIDWDAFLQTVRQFPHLQRIAIQCTIADYPGSSPHQMLVEFLAHLGGAWFGLDQLLGLYYYGRGQSGTDWVQVRLDMLMDEIKETRKKIKFGDQSEQGVESRYFPGGWFSGKSQ